MTSFPARLAVERSLSLAAEDRARNVFTKLFADEARALAEASDVARPAHPAEPLSGIPVTVKDNIDLIGRVTTAGSTLLGTASPARDDAPVVRRLRQAGLVILGHTNMTEFAFSGLGLNPHYGTPLNPAFPAERRIPGGSSSGAAVSVALGMAPFAVGTDTGGSVRIPAAFCGLAGFKPSAGHIPRRRHSPVHHARHRRTDRTQRQRLRHPVRYRPRSSWR